ncbi:MAG: hypothetical protein ABIK96_01580 [bacterium]
MSRINLLFILAVLGVAVAPCPAAGEFRAEADLRVRQEILDGVYHFAPDHDRNWIRVRSRVGFQAFTGSSVFHLRLTNEHRHYLHPDQDFDWDEVILDNASWEWRQDGTQVTVGRQDIIWPGGFLMLEGHPLDGSRSIYHNAVRVRSRGEGGSLDLAMIRNFRYDDLVIIDDEERALSDADEVGFALRFERGGVHLAVIHKEENDLDLRTLTLNAGIDRELCCGRKLNGDLALQYQDGDDSLHPGDGWAVAGQAFLNGSVADVARAEAGLFYYSGQGNDLRAFRTPWGRWPKWSELYIYTLIGESTPGRVHVAAWENIAAPRLTLTRDLGRGVQGKLGASYLLAPEPDWQARGLLTQMGATFKLGHGVDGHLLWEMLDPGSFHDGSNGLPPLTETAHFLRWQLTWAL